MANPYMGLVDVLTAVQDNPMSSRSNANSILDPVVKDNGPAAAEEEEEEEEGEEGCWGTMSCTAK